MEEGADEESFGEFGFSAAAAGGDEAEAGFVLPETELLGMRAEGGPAAGPVVVWACCGWESFRVVHRVLGLLKFAEIRIYRPRVR